MEQPVLGQHVLEQQHPELPAGYPAFLLLRAHSSTRRSSSSRSSSCFSSLSECTALSEGLKACHPSPFRVFLAFSGQENPETDWDDKTGLPRLVIPVRFGFLLALFGQKTLKRTGMTSLGFPGLSSQSVLGFCWPFSARKPRNGLG